MQCERLFSLAKSWYISVREETMAPARMVSFMEKHVAECHICQEDGDLKDEIAKITEIILPKSKIPKAVRLQNEQAEQAAAKELEESEENGEEEYEVDEEDQEPDLNRNNGI